MTMKMNIRKLLQDGNKGKPLPLLFIFLFIFLAGSLLSFFYHTFFYTGLHAKNQPFMRNFIIFISFMFFCFSCKQTQNIQKIGLNNDLYLIKKIDKEKDIYVIEAIRNDSLFKIVTDKKIVENCQKLKSGNLYKLKLNQIFPIKDANGSYYSMVKTFRHKSYVFKVDRKFHSTVYSAINLEGLCIVE